MKRLWLTLLLLGGSASALADGSSALPATDLSIKYLGQIFGDVPGVLSGNGSGLMAGLFGIFNKGVLIVASIWLMYTITQVFLITATNDGPQKSLKNWMIWFRVLMGFALLVPGPSGYCLAQRLMMEVVEQGVKLADETWSYALDYMNNGVGIFSSDTPLLGGLPVMKSADDVSSQLTKFIGVNGGKPSSDSMAYKLFSSEVCMYLSNKYNQAHPGAGVRSDYHMIPLQPAVFPVTTGSPKVASNTGTIYFPGGTDSALSPSETENSDGTISYGAPDHSCGSISIPSDLGIQSSDSPQAQSSALQTNSSNAFDAIEQAALDIAPFAMDVANYVNANSNSAPSINTTEGANDLALSVYDYLKIVQPIATYKAHQRASNAGNFVTKAKEQGWFNAGAFFWDLTRWNDALSLEAGEPQTVVPSASPKSPSSIASNITKAQGDLPQSWSGALSNISTLSQNGKENELGMPIVGSVNAQGTDFDIISGPMTNLVHMVSLYMMMPTLRIDPLSVSYSIGRACLGQAGKMWVIALASITGGSLLLSCCQGLLDAILAWIMPLLIAVTGFLFTAGAMLTFYVPLYPYFLFLFGVVGWVLSVAEAMVASPLVAFGMTHPEGHDFMGRVEQSLMLALSVFLRPALMIVGFLLGILMMYVATGFLNTVLGRVFVSAFRPDSLGKMGGFSGNAIDGLWTSMTGSVFTNVQGQFTGNDIADAICVPIILVLYAVLILEVTNQCFSAIHFIPDMVMRWIGAPVQGDQSAQHAQAIKGVMSSASQQGSQTLGNVSDGIAKGAGGMARSLGGSGGGGGGGQGGGEGGEAAGAEGGGAEAAGAAA